MRTGAQSRPLRYPTRTHTSLAARGRARCAGTDVAGEDRAGVRTRTSNAVVATRLGIGPIRLANGQSLHHRSIEGLYERDA